MYIDTSIRSHDLHCYLNTGHMTYIESSTLVVKERQQTNGLGEEEIKHRLVVFERNIQLIEALLGQLHLCGFRGHSSEVKYGLDCC